MGTFRWGWAVAALVAAPVAHGQEAAGDDVADGLQAEVHPLERPVQDFYDLLVLPDPATRRVDAKIEFADSVGAKPPVFIRWTGKLRVAKDGRYTFYTESSDGSRLYVGGVKVVSNGGRHPMTEESGEANLKKGTYAFRLEYFNSRGRGGCVARWKGPGIEKQVIPAEAFFHVTRAAAKPEPPAAKPEAPAPRETPDGPIAVDPGVAGGDGPAPGIVGRVSSVFSDGITTMVSIRIPPAERGKSAVETSVFVQATCEVRYVGLAPDVTRPARGMVAYVWLREGSDTDAAKVAFTAEPK